MAAWKDREALRAHLKKASAISAARPHVSQLRGSSLHLADGTVVLLSPEDAERAGAHLWYRTHHGYIFCSKLRQYLHRFILNAPRGRVVDHISGDRLDNRRENLRLCSIGNNVRNNVRRGGRFPYKGIYAHGKKFGAQIGRRKLGTFPSVIDAAEAYDRAALQIYGEFANLNFPEKRSHYAKTNRL